ncbi:MAG: RNA-binding protein [Candidatus Pacebacteria bacterium CG_4_10_14_0_8_um_filter_43_12]|nr:MAG: RNA-binding protein [Candidatus Pacebacteria bacterium CG10_big_fil_rev_8_21_14_0_10_44_11]PIY79372.1 MAG: RNA-binding protein [Candidatus Pacebacteria bacterium CG_4_10_14_0_8_um_filter_43_12]
MNESSQETNPKKIFVGNLSYNLTEDEVRNVFSQYGEIEDLRWITDRMSGRFKGLCFITYTTEEAAQKAIEAMHNQQMDDRAIIVNVARPQAPRENRGFGGGGGGGRSFGGGGRGFGGGDHRGGDRPHRSFDN